VGDRKPNIKSLARRKDVDGLVTATSYRDVKPSSPGKMTDFGTPVRAGAILALGALGPDCGTRAVEDGLRDPADHVRCAAVRVLHARQESIVLARALGWLPTERGNSRKLAVQALLELRGSVSTSVLANVLVHREDDELLGEPDAQLIMTLLGGEEWQAKHEVIKLLVQALGEESGIASDRAAELLVRLAPESIEDLVAELRTGSAPADAVYVLGRIGDPSTRDALVEALGHRDARVRAEGAAALAELEDPEAVKPLLQATRDPEHCVRVQASIALDRLGTTAVIVGVAALLEPMIQEAVKSVRRQPRARRSNGGPPEAVTQRQGRKQQTRKGARTEPSPQ
jgi:HEAT repeat protein